MGLLCVAAGPAFAQWRIQDIQLHSGWNAVQLEITPEPSACDKVFEGLPVESVWKWNKQFTTAEFTEDPGTLLPEDPHWLVWFPSNSPTAYLTRLYNLSGGDGYLIKLSDSAPSSILSLRGKAIIRNPEWVPNSLNLAGFPIDPQNPPTFADYFAFTPDIDTSRGIKNELYKVNPDGSSTRIVAAGRERMERDRAYWIKCKYVPKASSVLGVPEGSVLDFSDYVDEQSLTIRNQSSTDPLTVSLKEIASEKAPESGGFPENAGMVPLSYYVYDSDGNYWYWTNLTPNVAISKQLAPGEEWALNFAVRRSNMLPYTPSGTNGYAYQSLLQVSGDSPAGIYYVPVSATPVGDSNVVEQTDSRDKGLWVGEAKLYRVNCPAYVSDTETLAEMVFTNTLTGAVYTEKVATNMMPTDSVCRQRLIVHVDAAGQARLLREVFMANVPIAPEHSEYRLYADRKDIPADATDISRISCVTLPFMPPLPLNGSTTNSLSATFTIGCNDPVNPFLHRYNPLHDNKDWNFHTYSNAVETLDVTRAIQFNFGDGISSNAVENPFWGSSIKGGAYREILLGLRKQPIVVEGSFLLKRVSLLDELY